MKYFLSLILISVTCTLYCKAEGAEHRRDEAPFPITGLCISAPAPDRVNEFISFITDDLASRHINTLILMVNYGYRFESHPELNSDGALTKEDAVKITDACRKSNIKIIPALDLLGHQSWQSTPLALLKVYPEFDETPNVKFPEKYVWPNQDGLYCKSYCPLHPEVHKVIFDLVDELCDAFGADSFHAGMDEVFYIGESQCPRCSGRDKAELFAGEVTAIHDHLALKGRRLWIWGDRLIDGKTTGIGEWEGSYNNTYRAVDMIPKDVMICDWHYDRPDKTAVYFAMKGFDVVSCPWNNPFAASQQVQDMISFRLNSTDKMNSHFMGIVQTVWSGSGDFLDRMHEKKNGKNEKSEVSCFNSLCGEIRKAAEMKQLPTW
jgi:hypothetical protein